MKHIANICSDWQLTGRALFHIHTAVSATETMMLLVPTWGMMCYCPGNSKSAVNSCSKENIRIWELADHNTLWLSAYLHLRVVGWSSTSLFSTNMAISEKKDQGWKVIRTQWRKTSDILTSTLAAFLFSSHPKKRERDREAHLNYYARAYNRGDNYRITRLKLNRQQHNN